MQTRLTWEALDCPCRQQVWDDDRPMPAEVAWMLRGNPCGVGFDLSDEAQCRQMLTEAYERGVHPSWLVARIVSSEVWAEFDVAVMNVARAHIQAHGLDPDERLGWKGFRDEVREAALAAFRREGLLK